MHVRSIRCCPGVQQSGYVVLPAHMCRVAIKQAHRPRQPIMCQFVAQESLLATTLATQSCTAAHGNGLVDPVALKSPAARSKGVQR